MVINLPMWNRIVLRKRIYLVLAALVLITFMGGVVMIWYTYRIDGLITAVADQNIKALETAEDLQIALANQKGFVSYYFLDGNPDWLRQLRDYQQHFDRKLKDAQSLAASSEQRETLGRIADEYAQYVDSRDKVIALYKRVKPVPGPYCTRRSGSGSSRFLRCANASKPSMFKTSTTPAGKADSKPSDCAALPWWPS